MNIVCRCALVLMMTLLTHAGSVCRADDVPSASDNAASETTWWSGALSAARESVRTFPEEFSPPRLEQMPSIMGSLTTRLRNLKGRIGPDLLKELSGRDIALTVDDLYSRIPLWIRLGGENTIRRFLDERDLSHVESIKNAPRKALDPPNLVFEHRGPNRSRGSANMNTVDRALIWIRNLPNTIDGARVVALSSAKGVGVGVLLEVPVTVTVETLSVMNRGKTVEAAAWDGLQSLGGSALVAAAGTGVVKVAAVYGFTVGAPIVIPVVVVGGIAYVWVSGDRVWDSLDEDTRTELRIQLSEMQSGILELAEQAGIDYRFAPITLP